MIRKYEVSDLDSLLSVWLSASRLAHPFLSESFLATERKNIPNLYLPNAETWVTEVDKRIVAFIALIGNEIGALFVDPANHRQGIGGRLMDKAATLHHELEVEVFERNPIGRAFYDRYGFSQLERKIHEPSGQQVLRLLFKR